ncbi:MAG TPA: ferrous iron transport protein B [Clostridiales bacterium]|nr:ferrous iron transport protein B [Clostridiales bacterium]
MNDNLQVGFVGNPNSGKTTLFNAYTGANLKVANWPGVTVDKKEGVFKYHDNKFRLVDLPGIYSLTSYSMEEKLSREYILDSNVDVIINIVDASNLERNLYLTLQLIELEIPVVVALNMMDIVEERGMEIDLHRLPEMLGVPVIAVSAKKKTGLDILMHTVAHHKDKIKDIHLEHHHHYHRQGHAHGYSHSHGHGRNHENGPNYLRHLDYTMVYSENIENKIDEISNLLRKSYGDLDHMRWTAIKHLEMDKDIQDKYPIDLKGIVDHSYEEEIINQKYDFIEEIIEEVLVNKNVKAERTDKVEKWLTHSYLGLPIFFGIMALIFFLTFTIGDMIKGVFEGGLETFTESAASLLTAINAGEFWTSLIVDGIIAGVGGILTFLPNIFILFLALAFLEDSGYMARVAYVMEGIMSKVGLSGKAFIPMLLGFGCTVPAIMATRSLENMEDRRKTILITPFMSCSARLPIYVLFSQMFFGKNAMLVAYSMYLIGILVAIIVAYVMNKNTKKEETTDLLIELPEYKSPNGQTIVLYVWDKVRDYLSKAGTTIFAASVIVWFVLNFGPSGMVEDMSQSFGAIMGKALIPVMRPAGLGMWQIVVALIAGIAAKEVVVSSFSVLFGIANINGASGMASLTDILTGVGFGPLNAYSLMVFCLLYIPCAATIGVIQREMRSAKWTVFTVAFQLGVAWLMSTLVYQIGSLFI